MKLKLTILFILFQLSVFARQETYIISSGERGGNYYKTGIIIDSILNKNYPQFYFKNVWSKGSIDNLKNLEDKKADFALVQHNILLQNFYNTASGAKDIEVIIPLFEEELQIYCKAPQPIVSIEKLKDDLKKNIKIGVVSKESYSYKIFENIAQLLNIDFSKSIIIEGDYTQLIESFRKNEIDYIVSFSAKLQEVEKMAQKANVCFSNDEIEFILSRTKNLFKHKSSRGESFESYKIGTYTYLIGLSDKINELDEVRPVFEILQKTDTDLLFSKNIKQSISDFKSIKTQSIIDFLPLNGRFASEISHISQEVYIKKIAVYVLFSLFLMFLFLKRKQIFKFIKLKRNWYRYNHIFIGVLLLVFFYLITVELMIYGEKQLNESVNIKSQIINMPRKQLHFWLLTSNLSQNTYGIYPISILAKLMYSLSFYSLWLGGICIAVAEFLVKRIIRKRNSGMMKISYNNHTVITGWNKNTELFIKGFFSAREFVEDKTELVLVIQEAAKLREENKYIQELVDEKRISLVNGDIREEQTLIMANVYKAKTVVLFAEDNTPRADEKTLLRALSISRHCRKLALENTTKTKDGDLVKDNYIDSIYIIAEVNNNLYKEDLYKADVNEIICSAVYNKNIITQSIFNHGVSKVFDEVLNYNEFNEFYEIELKEEKNAKFRGRTFDELLAILRKADVLLIAIHKLYYKKDGELIIDKEEIKRLLAADGLTRELIINPRDEIEKKHQADNDDSLIVLCYDEKMLSQNLARLQV